MFAVQSLALSGFISKNNAFRGSVGARARRLARPLVFGATARVTARSPAVEAVLSRLDPTLSLHRILARVVEIREEAPGVKTFVLRPNARFGTFRPGAYVTVQVPTRGGLVKRSYSLSSAPSRDGLVSITVKRVPGGIGSNTLVDEVTVGQVLELGAPAGSFVLPAKLPAKLLLISAGSGITPVMSMLRHLVGTGASTEVTFLHFARTPEDVIFAGELRQIAERHPNVRVVVAVESAGADWTGLLGRFDRSMVDEVAPAFRETETFLCGPAPFMKAVMQAFETAGADLSKLHYERFDAGFDPSSFLEHSQVVRFVRSGVESLSNRPLTVLQEAEARGVRLDSGCRAGTCGTCRCKKKSGVVVNVATGEESGGGEEMIHACVSVARGTVEIEL